MTVERIYYEIIDHEANGKRVAIGEASGRDVGLIIPLAIEAYEATLSTRKLTEKEYALALIDMHAPDVTPDVTSDQGLEPIARGPPKI